MMKKCSVKLRITVWLTALFALLFALLLGLLIAISSMVITQTAVSQLSDAVLENLGQIRYKDGKLKLSDSFQFYQSNVSTLVYSSKKSLLAGQIPVSFTVDEPFQNGLTRIVDAGEEQYYVLDMRLMAGWDDGVWVRGMIEVPHSRRVSANLLLAALVLLPPFLTLAAFGSFQIARRAFRPLENITETAQAINEASDLSRRVGMPCGNDEFSKLADTFDRLFERLERLFEAEKQFTADASHELRTPVSIIKGACEYAKKYDETPQERQETISMIYRQAARMSALISQLLNMTRLEQGTEQMQPQFVDLERLLFDWCKEQGRPSNRLILQLQPQTVYANPQLLLRLVDNLVENAFKYGKPDGHVWLSVSRSGQEVLLQVRDDGIGIPEEQKDKIWQRFYQADTSRSSGTGAGLGLSMVKQIAHILDGYMTLESVPDAGSSFTLHLPAQGHDA